MLVSSWLSFASFWICGGGGDLQPWNMNVIGIIIIENEKRNIFFMVGKNYLIFKKKLNLKQNKIVKKKNKHRGLLSGKKERQK